MPAAARVATSATVIAASVAALGPRRLRTPGRAALPTGCRGQFGAAVLRLGDVIFGASVGISYPIERLHVIIRVAQGIRTRGVVRTSSPTGAPITVLTFGFIYVEGRAVLYDVDKVMEDGRLTYVAAQSSEPTINSTGPSPEAAIARLTWRLRGTLQPHEAVVPGAVPTGLPLAGTLGVAAAALPTLAAMPAAPPPEALRVPVGQLLAREGLIGEREIQAVLAIQADRKARGDGKPFGEVAVEAGYISEPMLRRAMSLQVKLAYPPGPRKPLGFYLIEADVAKPRHVALALEAQRRERRRIGEVLVERGWARPDGVAHALARQQHEQPGPARP